MQKRKSERNSVFIQAAGMVVSGVVFAFSNISTFMPTPQIADYRIGVVISFLLFAGFSLWHFYDLQARIKELESEIESGRSWADVKLVLSPNVNSVNDMISLDETRNITTARLGITNTEKIAITDCYATLESAEHYSIYSKKLLPAFSDVLLKWEGDANSDKDCKATIPSMNKSPKYISLWCKDRFSGFTFCVPNKKADLSGLYPVVIRIDGKINEKNIKPVYFNGYLYADSILIFREGDWEKDEDISYKMSRA